MKTAIAVATSAMLACTAAAAEPARVRIDAGTLTGDSAGGVSVFKGVPFAKPVIGPLRWAPPQDKV